MYNYFVSIALVACIFISATQAQGNIDIPQGNVMFTRVQGRGTYEYICENSAYKRNDGSGRGNLSDNSFSTLGTFSADRVPNSEQITVTFQMDGPAVTFNLDASQPSTNVNSLPNARYSITTGPTSGPLQGVTFVQSVDAKIETQPNPTCNNGDSTQVIFNTFFIFYKVGSSNPLTSTIPPTTSTIPPTTSTVPPFTPTTPPTTPTIPPTTSTSQPTESVPQEIAVPGSNVERFRVNGSGHYTYICQNSQWLTSNISSQLFRINDLSVLVGTMSIAPVRDANGGRVVFELAGGKATFKLVSTAFSETPLSVSRGLFEATTVGPGSLDKVTFVQRLSTIGGARPRPPCSQPNASITVPYTAVYAFFFSSQTT